MIKGSLSEAQAGCTTWKEVSKETFERFVQFAYTGDYSIPDWNKFAESQEADTDALRKQVSAWFEKSTLELQIRELREKGAKQDRYLKI